MAARIISQKKFAKLVSSTGPVAQPPNSLPRLSNLLFTTRGSLQIADGSLSIGQIEGYILSALNSFSNLELSQYPWYPALAYFPTPVLSNVTGFTAAPVFGLNNPAGTYQFAIVATYGAGHTSSVFASFTAASSVAGVTFNWTAVGGATGYKIYYTYFPSPHRPIVFTLLVTVGAVTTATFTGVFPLSPPVAPLPVSNTTFALQLFSGTPTSAGPGYVVTFTAITAGVFPFSGVELVGLPGHQTLQPYPATIAPGASNFALQTLPGFSPYGGLIGAAGPLPQIVQFARQSILILGNGYAPQSVDPSQGATAAVTPLQNTFQAAYPTWQAGVDWTTGSQIAVLSGSTNYLFTATQGGVSQTPGPPSWNFSTNAETSDNSVIWTCNGPIAVSIAPIGAAHAVAYAGSLWIANTWPTTTQYTAWSASTVFGVNAQIAVIDGSGNSWLFTAQNGGTSQTPGPPSWTFIAGVTTTDNTITWLCVQELSAALAAGIDGPSCLKMSDANNPNSWNPVNVAFIDSDDGTQITGLQPFTIAALGISPTGSLCVFKEFTTYQVIGVFGSTSFEVQPAQTNLGCIAARSIQFLPGFGVCRFTHLGFAVFDGINDRLISEDIRPYLFGGVNSEADLTPVDTSYVYLSQSAQTITPPMYICAMPLVGSSGSLTRLFCYDLVMKAWAILDLPWPITTLSVIASGEGYPLILAGKNDGTVQRMQSGDTTWDTGASDQSNVNWSFRTPDVYGEGGTQRIFYEEVFMKGYGNAAMVASMVANLWLDGANLGACGVDIVPQGGNTLFEVRFNIFRSGYRCHLDISGNNGGGAGTINTCDWAVVPKSAMSRRVIG